MFTKKRGGRIMGKKGKRAGKTGGAPTAGGKAATKPKQGPGKARRERAAALREIQPRLDALIAKLEEELRDVELFGPLEEREECPICFVPMPLETSEWSHAPCCGKTLCCACAITSGAKGHNNCEFCRAPILRVGIDDEALCQQLRNRVESGDAMAMFELATCYEKGIHGVQKDDIAAIKLLIQAAELGNIEALCDLADKHLLDKELEVRTTKEQALKLTKEQALKLAKAAAKKGSVRGHEILGGLEFEKDNFGTLAQALRHFIHAAIGGNKRSFDILRQTRDQSGVLDQDAFDDIEAKHKEALALEWSEERESYEANKNKTS